MNLLALHFLTINASTEIKLFVWSIVLLIGVLLWKNKNVRAELIEEFNTDTLGLFDLGERRRIVAAVVTKSPYINAFPGIGAIYV